MDEPKTDSKRPQKSKGTMIFNSQDVSELMFSENNSVDVATSKSGILPAYTSTISVLWS